MNDHNGYPLERATRNSIILDWWRACEPGFRDLVCLRYANELRCPIIEIDPDMTGEDSLDWLWSRYQNVVESWRQDRTL